MRGQEKIVVYMGDDTDAEETPVELPTKYEVCPQCEGKGKSSLYLGAYTRDEMDEAGPEFEDDYMAGAYDRTCETCNGERVVLVVDREACKRNPGLKAALSEYDEQQRINDEIDAMHAAELRYGC